MPPWSLNCLSLNRSQKPHLDQSKPARLPRATEALLWAEAAQKLAASTLSAEAVCSVASYDNVGVAAISTEWPSEATLEIAVARHAAMVPEVDVHGGEGTCARQAIEMAILVAHVFAHLRARKRLWLPFVALEQWNGHLVDRGGEEDGIDLAFVVHGDNREQILRLPGHGLAACVEEPMPPHSVKA